MLVGYYSLLGLQFFNHGIQLLLFQDMRGGLMRCLIFLEVHLLLKIQNLGIFCLDLLLEYFQLCFKILDNLGLCSFIKLCLKEPLSEALSFSEDGRVLFNNIAVNLNEVNKQLGDRLIVEI